MKNHRLKIGNWKLKIGDFRRGLSAQAGMTYVELIVVFSIFSVMTSVVMFNYGEFQAKVDIKNLASDIALKLVEAQKSALSGQLSTQGSFNPKPAYGVYFNLSNSTSSFIYFADFNNNSSHDIGETLDTISITKGNYIEKIDVCTGNPCTSPTINSLSITFKRPDSRAVFIGASVTGSQYIQITIKSPQGANATIKVYPAGRIQVD